VNEDCAGVCGGDAVEDCALVCGGDAFETDCGCNVVEFVCSDGSEVCDETQCPSEDVFGCTDDLACNPNADATADDGSCVYPETNFDCDGICTAEIDECGECGGGCVLGCTDQSACNYNETATDDDESCTYPATSFEDCSGQCVEGITADCSGQCGGFALVDDCGVCDDDILNNNSTCEVYIESEIETDVDEELVEDEAAQEEFLDGFEGYMETELGLPQIHLEDQARFPCTLQSHLGTPLVLLHLLQVPHLHRFLSLTRYTPHM
jgi:hypothetical protein